MAYTLTPTGSTNLLDCNREWSSNAKRATWHTMASMKSWLTFWARSRHALMLELSWFVMWFNQPTRYHTYKVDEQQKWLYLTLFYENESKHAALRTQLIHQGPLKSTLLKQISDILCNSVRTEIQLMATFLSWQKFHTFTLILTSIQWPPLHSGNSHLNTSQLPKQHLNNGQMVYTKYSFSMCNVMKINPYGWSLFLFDFYFNDIFWLCYVFKCCI